MSHVINNRALTSENPRINNAIHALLMHSYATFNMIVPGPQFAAVTRYVLPGPSPWKLRSRDIGEKAKQNSARNIAKCTKYFQFLCNNSDQTWLFEQCINIHQVPWEVLKTASPGLGFQHLPRDLANVNA